jgi:hypothetical protein
MQTTTQTTYIMLERGVEDRALWEEINKITVVLKTESIKSFIKEYPLLYELKLNLKDELDTQE